MIVFAKEDRRSQAGMERAFRDCARRVQQEPGDNFNRMLDVRFVDCNFENRTVTLAVETKPWMANPDGMTHGGVIASMLDLVMGLASCYFSGRMTPTINLNVTYLHPVPLGACVLMRSQVTMPGFHLCSVTAGAWIDGAPDRLVATGCGTYYESRANA